MRRPPGEREGRNVMRFLTSKILWLTIYAIVITGVFLYLLFPSALVLRQIEGAAGQAGFTLKAGSLHPSLPLGIKFQDLTVRLPDLPGDVFFQGEVLDLQVNPLTIFGKRKTLRFNGRSYNGSFDGSAGFSSFSPAKPPAEGKINFRNIDLARYNPPGFPFLKGMTGLARGSAFYAENDPVSRYPLGKLALYLSRGSFPLREPFLGVSRIDFDRGEIQAQLKNGVVMLEKLEIYGPQMNCFLNGSLTLADRPDDSRLDLKGVLEIAGKNKIKMNVTVGGTLANPSVRYI
ncbi:MAG: type II secretion system protein GspN [Deltaproteobacteria bacterium]|nr:type II secretion system protein GspN [Deltaproteobacteria bacterium]